jgi:glucose-6-phosphate 1-epimerase
MTLEMLNATYGIAGSLEFTEGEGGLPTAVITTPLAEAAVSLYGAHVLSYRPRGKGEVLWMSSLSEFEVGKPIRGGIPVCFPWFGPHATDAQKPQHGFARVEMWNVAGTSVLPDGRMELCLSLKDNPSTLALWPFAFAAEVCVRVGTSLEVTLRCTNTGAEECTYTDALHSYFAVSDIANVDIRGLAGAQYYEGFGTVVRRQDEEALAIVKEENRRYVHTDAECVIRDSVLPRTIRVAKSGSRVTVVWNPWDATAKKIADMPDAGYRTMICVEAVNAYDDGVVLQPQAQHCLGTIITVE